MPNHRTTPLRRVSILAIDQVFASTLMQAKDFFYLASLRYGKQLGQGLTPAFETRLVSPDGQPVASFSKVILPVDGGLEDTDVIILPAFWDDFQSLCQRYPQVMPWLQAQHARGAVLCGEATGVFWLAEAGLLDGRRATTHWCHAPALQRAYPKVRVEEDRIFINDGNVWTAAGMSACVDLALALVEKDLGADVARRVARQLVVYHRRAGGQSQFSVMLELEPKTDRIQSALIYAKQNLKSELSVEALASAANLSPRQFSRVFHAETGQSPAKAIENLRVEAARLMMETGRHAIDVVATETGFGDRERMRRAFIRAFGQPPQVIQRANRS